MIDLQTGQLPKVLKEVGKMKKSAAFYAIVDGQLYKRGYSVPFLKCIDKDKVKYTMAEVNEGVCSHQLGGRSLSGKILRAGYY